jgi:hypothetical protein
MKNAIKQITPPLLWNLGRAAARRLRGPQEEAEPALFDGEDALFVEAVANARAYGEYGMGTSTRWMARNTTAQIHAVDSARAWVEDTRRRIGDSERVRLDWIDVGPVGAWGMPRDFSRRQTFLTYVRSLWEAETRPEVVLIDGRFRLACWFESIASAPPGARIVFDDYVGRAPFYVVEEYLKPARTNSRQALFVVPETVDRDALRAERDAFLMMRD